MQSYKFESLNKRKCNKLKGKQKKRYKMSKLKTEKQKLTKLAMSNEFVNLAGYSIKIIK